jgi:hypothetical protein
METISGIETSVYDAGQGRVFCFNDHVVVEMLLGVPDEQRTGRLVQVRKGKGGWMSDQFFIRLRDGSLHMFHNAMVRHVGDKDFEEAFYRSNGRTPPVVPHQPPYEGDSEETEYSLGDKFPETGFVIEHPAQPDAPAEAFTMTIHAGPGQ